VTICGIFLPAFITGINTTKNPTQIKMNLTNKIGLNDVYLKDTLELHIKASKDHD